MSRALPDEQSALIEGMLSSTVGRQGWPFRDHRQVVEGFVYRYRTGVAWRDLPERFGPWQTVWKRHHRWSLDGTRDRVLAVPRARANVDRRIDRRASVDSSVVRTHHHAATLPRDVSRPASLTGAGTTRLVELATPPPGPRPSWPLQATPRSNHLITKYRRSTRPSRTLADLLTTFRV